MAKANKAGGLTPAVIVLRDCKVFWDNQMLNLKKDEKVDGPLAVYLMNSGAPVEVINDAGGKSE